MSHAKSTAKCTKRRSSISGKQYIKVSGLQSFRESFSWLTVLSPVLESQVQTQITTRTGENGLAGVLEKKLIRFSVL